MLESKFNEILIAEIKRRFPGCVIKKQDPLTDHQGIPDKLILWNDRWAMLESKAYLKASRQPNQEYWVDRYNELSFAAFVSPENYIEVLDEMESALSR